MAEDDPFAAKSTIPARSVPTYRKQVMRADHLVRMKLPGPWRSLVTEAMFLDLEDKIHKQLQRRLELEKYLLELESQGSDTGTPFSGAGSFKTFALAGAKRQEPAYRASSRRHSPPAAFLPCTVHPDHHPLHQNPKAHYAVVFQKLIST